MKLLVVLPMAEELEFFCQALGEQGWRPAKSAVGRIQLTHFRDLGLTAAAGGLGKTQFGVQTQHLLDSDQHWSVVVCAGAAGALVDGLEVGDVVVATETVEHDIRNRFGPPRVPRFDGHEPSLEEIKRAGARLAPSFQVLLGPIASGDEDVVDAGRRKSIHELTGALAVAWEGAGGARACHFSGLPFVEIRGISDGANSAAAADFALNLPRVMENVALLVASWARWERNKSSAA
jgi:adenosylhomocysteine nucleosidase